VYGFASKCQSLLHKSHTRVMPLCHTTFSSVLPMTSAGFSVKHCNHDHNYYRDWRLRSEEGMTNRLLADAPEIFALVIIEDCGHLAPTEGPYAASELLRYWLDAPAQ
jgi:hypothetical protein